MIYIAKNNVHYTITVLAYYNNFISYSYTRVSDLLSKRDNIKIEYKFK